MVPGAVLLTKVGVLGEKQQGGGGGQLRKKNYNGGKRGAAVTKAVSDRLPRMESCGR